MFNRLFDVAVKARWAVLALTLLVAGIGVYNLMRLPIDAVPDITNKQVQVNTVAEEFGPLDVERLVTFPVETAMSGIPGLQSTRSISRNGFSQVTVVFDDSVDVYFARQQVSERLGQARESLPAGVEPQMGPISTGLGEVLMWTVAFAAPSKEKPPAAGQVGWQPDGSFLTPEGELLSDDTARASYLRTVQDWIVRPQMRGVKGVAGIDSIGGYEKQFVVEPDQAALASYGISFSELAEALEAANLSVGANFIQRGGEAFLVRADARIRTAEEISKAVVTTREGVAIMVRDVAHVRIGGALRTGSATSNGKEVVVGTVLMLTGENSRTVAADAAAKLKEITTTLPPGVEAKVVYDRSKLVSATIGTVERNLAEGALLVAVSLFLLLGNVRAALIATLVIPISMVMTAMGMNTLKVSGNLMSLGALDFGLIVDGSVIIIENCLRRLAERQHHEGRLLTLQERLHETAEAGREMIKPTVFGQIIIFLVFAPLLTFSGVEGKMFSPMAITLMLALGAAFILSLTFVPAMVAVLIRGKVSEKDVMPIAVAKKAYEPSLRWAIRRPTPVIGGGVAVFALAGWLFMSLGQEFIPTLDEQDLAVQALRIPSTSLEQSTRMQERVETTLAQFDEVAFVYSKTGTAEVASDPMPPNASDSFVILKPKEEWKNPSQTKAELIGRMEKSLTTLVGNNYEFSQPIQMRFNELIAGVRGDVAIKLYGDDLDAMSASAGRIAAILQSIPGAADVKAEQTAGFPTLDVQFDRDAIARYGLTLEEVTDTVASAMAGREAGIVFEGDRRFDVVVRLPNAVRDNLDAVGALPVMLPEQDGIARGSVPLRELAQFKFSEGLNQVSRETGKRRVVIQANVRGRDLGSFVAEAQRRVTAEATLPTGSWIVWGGQFENLRSASERISLVVPACFLLIFGVLYAALASVRGAISVFAAVPLALAGGVFTLFLTGMPFSISAAVGFICLSGVAVLNGLVVMTSINKRLDAGMPVDEAIHEGMLEKFRAVLMTGIVPAIGFVPMAIAHGVGAEVQKPLATVVIGGLITATLLTLFVLPAICRLLLKSGHRTKAGEMPTAYSAPAHAE
ncbi:Nickel-cobalt-cadmium resistance protein NccA [uncultured Defluviicoccus sp.]|uniref:Nickel-cobalt-cadmium resistance protein NccA n=1 Tax=metagenome TaxID=256318 RepID=A0A380T9H5_9ZZZZ|nr:Nickel-cobalt-cadmium resistance protein NccA [uncultured Defluviicoccus sp.]